MKYKYSDINASEKFKKWVYSVFEGPLFFLYGLPLKSDRKTPKTNVLTRIGFQFYAEPFDKGAMNSYIKYKKNLLRCSNGKCMIFDKSTDFTTGIYSKYWMFYPDLPRATKIAMYQSMEFEEPEHIMNILMQHCNQ